MTVAAGGREFLRAHWPALLSAGAGAVVIILVSLSGAGTGAVMVAGGVVGVLIGGVVARSKRAEIAKGRRTR